MNWKKRTHEEWTKLLAGEDYDVFGTLKFDNGRFIHAKQAQSLFKAYWHKVDRIIYGQAADKGYGVKRWCFAELGADNRNLHLHFVAASPFAPSPFCAVLNALWVNFSIRTADYDKNWITPINDKHDAAAYTCKSTKQFVVNAIGLATSFQPNPNLKHDTFDTEAQIKRINSRLTNQQLAQACNELNRQIEATEQRRIQRDMRKA